jgi:hypothetical protein
VLALDFASEIAFAFAFGVVFPVFVLALRSPPAAVRTSEFAPLGAVAGVAVAR